MSELCKKHELGSWRILQLNTVYELYYLGILFAYTDFSTLVQFSKLIDSVIEHNKNYYEKEIEVLSDPKDIQAKTKKELKK